MSTHCSIRGCAEDKGDHLRGPAEDLGRIRTKGARYAPAHNLPSAPPPRQYLSHATDVQYQLSARTSACSSSFRGRKDMTSI